MTQSLSPAAKKTINDFFHITAGAHTVPCLYYNNKRQQIRAGLRVSIGKGTAKEIETELTILAQRDGINLQTMDEDMIRMFMQKHNIGIDCSGYAYYILQSEITEKTNTSLRKMLSFPHITNPLRKLIPKLRTIENTNVKTFAHEKNSVSVELTEVQPADVITILGGGRNNQWNHILVVTDVRYSDQNIIQELTYTHSYQWSTDGQYHHGVRHGTIQITDPTKSILNQIWTEKEKTGKENETFQKANAATEVSLRRLQALV